MLNELYSLSTALESKGIPTKEWHREYNPLPTVTPKAPCIRIWLTKNNTICEIESISADLALSLRKYGNYQGTFPAFNIVPLYRITDEKLLAELEKMEKNNLALDVDKIRSWCTNDNWQRGVINKVNRSLHKKPQRLLELLGTQEQPEYHLILEMIHLAASFSDDTDSSFKSALEKCIFYKLQKQEDVKLSLSMLFHKGDINKEPQKDIGAPLSIVLDVFDWQQHGRHPVTSKQVTEWINEMLLRSSQTSISLQSESSESDAFGDPFINAEEPMHEVKLNGFNVILRSMFNGQPCQYRYRKIDDASYPITMENRSLAKKSLEWIAASDREGITWQKVDKSEIVFVYPSRLPEVLPKFASVFGTSQHENSAQTESRFENIAEDFIKTLRGLKPAEKPSFIQIFTIRKVAKGRSKVLFTRNCLPEQFIQAANDWVNGCRNLPVMEVGEIVIPFPLQVPRIVNNVWKQNGELAQGQATVERMKFYQGLELLLGFMQENMTSNYLHILLTNSMGLIKYIGNCAHSGWICKNKTEVDKLEKLQKETRTLLPMLGLLLYKHDGRKENYMENMAYLVGQLLKISDELHALYCKVVRNGDVPPQLVGSALFVTASEIPSQAITQLSIRMNPYITWAKQYRYKSITTKNEESWKAAWLLKLYEDVANKLNIVMEESTRFSDFNKAQLFIGYLASFPKSEPTITKSAVESNNGNMIGGSDNEQ